MKDERFEKNEINSVNNNVEKLYGMFKDLNNKFSKLINKKKQKKLQQEDNMRKNELRNEIKRKNMNDDIFKKMENTVDINFKNIQIERKNPLKKKIPLSWS